jgi:hypothetical protein
MRHCRWIPLLICCWIATGQAGEPYGRFQFDESDREHWSFMPVVRPEVPTPPNPEWVRTPIDAFIAERLADKGLAPAGDASKPALLRRVYFDLIGLPPTPAETAEFLADESPDAYAKLVDRLLARPEYGERWARHWLDVVRYAESNGYERDGAKPHAWRYRDYVIDALNQDKPYDRFVLEQVAGDELPDTNAETQIATTFLRLGPWDDEPADPKVDRLEQLDDVVGTTATTFLGLTLRCARCHDHKFEPFSQMDYGRVMAIFEPLVRPQSGRTDLDRMVGTPEEIQSYQAAMSQCDAQVADRNGKIDERKRTVAEKMFADNRSQLPEAARVAFLAKPDSRDDEQKKLVKEHQKQFDDELRTCEGMQEVDAWQKEIEEINRQRPAELPRAYTWYENGTTAEVSHIFQRGDPYSPLQEVEPGLPAILVEGPLPTATPTAHSTGRRLQLAQWLVQPDHPLTARVMVNRIWQHHFGNGIVATENDFGVMGEPPSHPELLDWLAAEFVASGWRLKAMHRLMLLSHAYQLSAVAGPELLEKDPKNELLGRWKPRRLEAESVRDAVLATSGQLNSERGGKSVFPVIAKEVLATQSQPGNGWTPSDEKSAARRSVYVFVKRTLPVPEMEVLDFPSSEVCCEQRGVSTIAPQALTYLNGAFMQSQARHMAARLKSEAGTEPDAQINLAFRLAMARGPESAEREEVREFLKQQAEQIAADRTAAPSSNETNQPTPPPAEEQALAAFCLVLLNSNEFFYVD